MRTRNIKAVSALAALGVGTVIGLNALKLQQAARTGQRRPELSAADAIRARNFRRDEIFGEIRTTAAMLRYLLQPGPLPPQSQLIVSNATGKTLPGPVSS